MTELLHDDRCHICRRTRQLRRRAIIVKLTPWACVLAFILALAATEGLTK